MAWIYATVSLAALILNTYFMNNLLTICIAIEYSHIKEKAACKKMQMMLKLGFIK